MIKKEDEIKKLAILVSPEEHGYDKCESCDGYGGDNRRADGVPHELCEDCGGDGVIPKPEEDSEETTVIYDESGFSSGAGVV